MKNHRNYRRHCILVHAIAVSYCLLTSFAMAQPSNSIRYAKKDKVDVYCGPGDEFYTTSQLKQGAAVEVFHRTKDGWCGIRPPEGSFGWLAASNAYLLPGGNVAEVVGNKVPAWIGTQINEPKQLRWQLELQPSQQVRVLGEAKQKFDSETERLWYRIAPPQGEFRWVRERDLSEQPPIADPTYPPLVAQQSPHTKGIEKPLDKSPSEKVSQASATTPVAANPPKQAGDKAGMKSPNISNSNSQGDNEKKVDKGVQRAQYEEPLPPPSKGGYQLNEGEYIVGEETVVSDRVVGQEGGTTYSSEGYPSDGSTIVPEPMMEEDLIVDEEMMGTPDPSDQFHQAHGEDPSMDKWSAINTPPARVFVKPLNGLLGLIGFGIAEAEIVEPEHEYLMGHTAVGRFGNPTYSSGPVGSSILDNLPRPSRRTNGRTIRSLLQSNQNNIEEFQAELSSRSGSAGYSSGYSAPLGSQSGLPQDVPSLARGSDWHAGDSSTESRSLSGTSAKTARPGSLRDYQSGSSNASDLGLMQLSTPELQDAFLELTRIVSAPTETWDLRTIQGFAKEWVENGSSAIERGEARLLLDRIQQFESVRQRMAFGTMTGVSTASANISAQSPAATFATSYDAPASASAIGTGVSNSNSNWTQRPEEAELPLSAAKQADASGWLVPVHTSNPGQPEFALQDSNGNLIAYVVPSPGMNLRRYTKQMVGIFGSKGFLPELKSRQIVAERIVRLR